MTADAKDDFAVRQSVLEMSRAMTCVFRMFEDDPKIDPSDVVDEIGEATVNTFRRNRVARQFDRAVDGWVMC